MDLIGADLERVTSNGAGRRHTGRVDLRRVDLNLLVALDALLAERSVTRAANRLSIGQSAMSSTLGRLRKLFGDPMLVREGRVLVATPLAVSLQAPVRELLAGVESILSVGQSFDPAAEERSFTILASEFVLLTFLQPLLIALQHEAPGVRLTIRPPGDDYVDQLRRRQVDAVILPREVLSGAESFRQDVLFQDNYVCAVDRNHPDVGDTITLEQLTSLPYLGWTSGRLPSLVDMQFDLLGIQRKTDLRMSLGVAPFVLAGTRLVTIIPSRMAAWASRLADLRLLSPPISLPPMTETLLWMPSSDADPGHRWLRDRFRALTESQTAGHVPELAPA